MYLSHLIKCNYQGCVGLYECVLIDIIFLLGLLFKQLTVA